MPFKQRSPNAQYIESVLRGYGFEQIKRTKNGFTTICKFHADTHPSLSISDTGLWLCWACGAKGSLRKLHELMGGNVDWKEELRIMGVQMENSGFSRAPVASRAGEPIGLPRGYKAYEDPEAVPEHIAKRLAWETILHFRLGRCPFGRNAGRCVIPISYRGSTVGYHSRALDAELVPRYYNPAGFDIKEHVFNFDSCKKGGEVIVVEGAFNAMSMWEKGFQSTMAVFGTKFTSAQIGRIGELSPESVVICFDRDSKPDRPGQRAAMKLGALLSPFIPTSIMPLPWDRDPNTLPAGVLRECLDRRMPYESLHVEK